MRPPTMESMAGQIADMCPGWRVWVAGGRWRARRDGALLERPDDRRGCHVDAGDIGGLVAAIDAQAGMDLAADFPLWSVARDDLGRWSAAFGGVTVTALTGAWLYSALGARQEAGR